jgi:hypothetical protein
MMSKRCPTLQSIPIEIPPLGLKDSIILSFLVSKLSEVDTPHQGRASIQGRGMWIDDVPSKSNNTLKALAAIIFGRVHHSSRIVEEGRYSYGKAISDLRIDLLDSSKAKSFDTLASVTVLCMYEVSHPRG